MNWMKYPVTAVAIAAAGWSFLLVFASPTYAASYEIISAPLHDVEGGYHHADTHHPEHEDHIDPEPSEMYEGTRGLRIGDGPLPTSLFAPATSIFFAHLFKEALC